MNELFTALNDAAQGSIPLAATAAFAWGVLSILLSPCHLSSIPLIVAYIGEAGARSPRRAFALSAVFAVGILVTIGLIGVVTAALGRMLGDVGTYGNYLIALIFFSLIRM